jgi:hypothetical protein
MNATFGRVAVGSLAVISGVFAAVLIRHWWRSAPDIAGYDPGWDLPDDLIQAAANALPHESGAFNIPAARGLHPRPPD